MQLDGLKRTYLCHVPVGPALPGLRPLLVVLHGGEGKGKGMVKLTRSRFEKLADRDGWLVVYPDGVDGHWNDGRGVQLVRAQRDTINDVKFIGVLIDTCVVRYHADPARVYVTGISNGAMMAHRLAIELSDRIAALAAVAGNLPEPLLNAEPRAAVPALIINGTLDPLVPWDGGEIKIGQKQHGHVLSVARTVSYWARNNQCSTLPDSCMLIDRRPEDRTRVQIITFGNGVAPVVLYAIERGGHTWPGGRQYLPEKVIGKTCRDFDAADVIWDFCKQHSRTVTERK